MRYLIQSRENSGSSWWCWFDFKRDQPSAEAWLKKNREQYSRIAEYRTVCITGGMTVVLDQEGTHA